ncbi:MAG: threonine synthase [Acidobacteria bacterium]|nr:threonine synthase [Acidobacteriota bacterium]
MAAVLALWQTFRVSNVVYLECTRCGEHFSPEVPQNVCPNDAGILFARYDLSAIRRAFKPEKLRERERNLWRYREVLPDVPRVSLGEGFTPLGASREFPGVWIKDEGLNPTGSFKARGAAAAISAAKSLGIRKIVVSSAGHAASALAAYAAAAGMEAHIFLPSEVARANRMECEAYGARVTLVPGNISNCARLVGERKQQQGWFDVSTLKEPYRVEGKKTMAYELFEQLDGELPDAVIFPGGGGVGVIGMWKAFDEMEELGWMPEKGKRPRMIVVQAGGCGPIRKAWIDDKAPVEMGNESAAIAPGLRVRKPHGDYLVVDVLRRSGGAAVAVTDEEIKQAVRDWATREGILAAPEGAASLAAYRKLRMKSAPADPVLGKNDKVVLVNTGTGLKYLGALEERKGLAERHIGGIIGPY